MTLPLAWTDDATRDLLAICHDQRAAETLPDRPYIYRPGRVAGTREAVAHPNYLLVYRVTGTIEISPSSTLASVTPEAPPPRATPH